MGLSQTGDISAVEGLEQALLGEEDEQVRNFIEDAIDSLQSN